MTARAPGAFFFSLLLHGAIVAGAVALFVGETARKPAGAPRRIRVCLANCVVSKPVLPKKKVPAVKTVPKPVKPAVKKVQPVKKKFHKKKRTLPRSKPEHRVKQAVKKAPASVRLRPPAETKRVRNTAAAMPEERSVPHIAPQARPAAAAPAKPLPAPAVSVPPQTQADYLDIHLARISELLREHLYYPRMARKRRIQGEVVASFVVETDGTVHNLCIKKHSRPILDRAAIETVESLSGKLPHPKNRLELEVPIRFVLR